MRLLLILTVLSGILNGEYNAATLSVEEQDSILNDGMSATASLNDGMMRCTRYRLEKENEEKIYRHSYVADWYIVDTMRNTRKQLGEGIQNTEYRVQTGLHRVRDAQMSPNGRYVAFAIGNNLYIHKCDFGTEVAV
ncbi:MAG: DPP IV N-terminal domain-containing protein, partial [Paludibacteraceae bacterium]|nr:DPP IV N-terminal domain-containing protein [Paludibacteraceae bacterium]